jgi:hypothetical protein
MTQTFGVNANNDIYIGTDGNLVIDRDIQAVLTACAQTVKTRLGEMVLAINDGLPYFETVWVGVPNIPQFEMALRRAILAVSGVNEILSLTTSQTGDVLSYTAVILTIFGQGTING